jgi:hypothetical protein
LAGVLCGYKTKHPPGAIVNWYCERVKQVEPAPLGKPSVQEAVFIFQEYVKAGLYPALHGVWAWQR